MQPGPNKWPFTLTPAWSGYCVRSGMPVNLKDRVKKPGVFGFVEWTLTAFHSSMHIMGL